MNGTTDWIQLFKDDRNSMLQTMRRNAAADLEAGYSIGAIAKQMCDIADYDRETTALLARFNADWNPQRRAYEYLKKVGAIA